MAPDDWLEMAYEDQNGCAYEPDGEDERHAEEDVPRYR